jgi:uncharacterized membrane protein (DUF485 family)
VDNDEKLRSIARRTRRRLLFSLITLVLYFSYTLNYTGTGARLGARLGESHVTGSLLMFVSLILAFIGLELLFLLLNRRQERGE